MVNLIKSKVVVVCVSVKQVAIPVVPTVRVVITFTKFVELQPVEQFYTPLSSPRHFFYGGRSQSEEDHKSQSHYSSLPSSSSSSSSSSTWLRRSYSQSGGSASKQQQQQQRSAAVAQDTDPFAIPSGYTWTSADDKSKKMKKSKSTRKSK